jgi:hypothetical protein
MLLHVQMPGARFVAPPHRWCQQYCRYIKANARPLVILQPMGPVMFVFDVSDTRPLAGTDVPLPFEVEHPFEVRRGEVGEELERTIENARGDGVEIIRRKAGSQSAGLIRTLAPGGFLEVLVKKRPKPEYARRPARYEVLLNQDHSPAAQYATLVHELAHLYCGHLGTPDPKWWSDRCGLGSEVCELEAESVSYLVCSRLGIDSPADVYVADYVEEREDTLGISIDAVVKVARLIEQMGRERMPLRKVTQD